MQNHIAPAVDGLSREGQAAIGELRNTARTLDAQLAANGQAAQALLTEGTVTIAATREEAVAVLQELRATSHGLQVLTNDPSLQQAIDDLAAGTYEGKQTLANVQLISEDLAG